MVSPHAFSGRSWSRQGGSPNIGSVSKSILPLTEIPRPYVTELFRGRDLAVTQWKYFDDEFNRSRNRGFAWMQHGKVRGFVGIIPATIARDGESMQFAWTCDWLVADPSSAPGMGVILLRHAVAAMDLAATLGGNANTQRLLPRMADQVLPSAARYFWRPLRASALFYLVSSRVRALEGLRLGGRAGALRLPWRLRRPSNQPRVAAGVASALENLLESHSSHEWAVRYDLAHLKWSVERCPGLVSSTCYVPDGSSAIAASVLWHAEHNRLRHVRFAHWSKPGEEQAAHDVITESIRRAKAAGAALISTVVSAADTERISVLRGAGFLPRRAALPLYLSGPTWPSLDRLGGLDYFASDFAQVS